MEYVLHHGCIFGLVPHHRAAHQYIEGPTGAHLYGDWIPGPRDIEDCVHSGRMGPVYVPRDTDKQGRTRYRWDMAVY